MQSWYLQLMAVTLRQKMDCLWATQSPLSSGTASNCLQPQLPKWDSLFFPEVVPAHDAPEIGLPVKWDSVMRENTPATNTEMQNFFFLNSQNLTSVFLRPYQKLRGNEIFHVNHGVNYQHHGADFQSASQAHGQHMLFSLGLQGTCKWRKKNRNAVEVD